MNGVASDIRFATTGETLSPSISFYVIATICIIGLIALYLYLRNQSED